MASQRAPDVAVHRGSTRLASSPGALPHVRGPVPGRGPAGRPRGAGAPAAAASVEVFATADAERPARRPLRWPRDAADVDVAAGRGRRRSTALAETVTPQGVVAVCRLRRRAAVRRCSTSAPTLVAICANVRDPGNAGTVIRCADAAGADAVVLAGDVGRPVQRQGGAGLAPGRSSTCRSSTGVPVTEAVEQLRAAGLSVLAADGAGEADLDELLDAGDLAGPTAWMFGNEAWGLPAETPALADAVVRRADLRPGREPQPRDRRRRLPLRLGARPASLTAQPQAVPAYSEGNLMAGVRTGGAAWQSSAWRSSRCRPRRAPDGVVVADADGIVVDDQRRGAPPPRARRRRPRRRATCRTCWRSRTSTAATGSAACGRTAGCRSAPRLLETLVAHGVRRRGAGHRAALQPRPAGRPGGVRSAWSLRDARRPGTASSASVPTWSPPSPTSCARR